MHVDQLKRAAAEIADNAIRLVNAGHDAERSEMRLTLSGKDCDRGAADAFGFGDERAAVARVAASGRSNRPNPAHMQDIAQGAKTPERIERRVDGISGQQPGRLHLPPEAGQHFLVEDWRRRARQPFIDNKTD